MRRLGMLCIGLLLTIAGCGGDGKKAAEVAGGAGAKVRVSGVAYSFELPTGYGRVDKTEAEHAELVESVSKQGPRAPVNVDEAMWGDKDADQPVVIFVIVQPLTADTTQDAFYEVNETQITSQHADAVPEAVPARLGDAPARGMRYESPEGVLNHTIYARKGDYEYVVNVSAYDDYEAHLETVAGRVARSWRFVPDATGKAQLDKLQDFHGTGYQLRLPRGWVAFDRYTSSETGEQVTADGQFFGHQETGANSLVSVGIGPADATSLDGAIAQVMTEERAGTAKIKGATDLHRGRALTLDGEPAQALELRLEFMGHTFREREVVALHNGNIARVTLGSAPDRFADEARTFDALLRSWHWTD